LTDYLTERYARQLVLKDIGPDGQDKLRDASVAVVGVGGLGASSAMLLARMGVGTLYLIDRDLVSLSDLHRQFLYEEDDIGLPKVYAAEKRIKRFNSGVTVYPIAASLQSHMAADAVGKAMVIADGLDSMPPRYYLNRLAVKLRKPYVFASAIETYGNVSTILPGTTPCLEEFYGGLYDVDLPKCAEVGIYPSILSVISGIAVAETISILTGNPPRLAGKLLLADLHVPSTEVVDLSVNRSCPVCNKVDGEGINPPTELKFERVELGCSRNGLGTFFIRGRKKGGLDLKAVEERLMKAGYPVLRNEPYYILFKSGPDDTITILRGGDAIAQVSGPNTDLKSIKRRLEDIYDAVAG